MKRFGLRAKFILFIFVVLAIIFAMVSVILLRINTNTLRSNLESDSKTFATLATEPIGKSFVTYKDSGRLRISDEIQRFTDLDSNISNVSVVNSNGEIVHTLRQGIAKAIEPKQAASFDPIYIYSGKSVIKKIIVPYFEEFGAHRYSIVYDITAEEVEAALGQVASTVLFFVLLALISSVTLSYFLINFFFINPIRVLSQQAMAISAGQLDTQIKVDRDDEISDLASSVNSMAQSLQDDIAKLKETDRLKTEFMIIASHNLRTPLTVINGYLDMKKDLKTVEQLQDALTVIASRSKQLGVFAEDVLTISNIEAGKHIQQFEAINLDEFVKGVSDEFQDSAKQKGLEFVTSVKAGSAKVKISQPHMRSAIWNLLDNALKFTTKGGKIELATELNDKKALISVRDDGIGISTEEMPKLFTKFHRGTDILKYDYEGTGIGLYVTKMILNEHQGEVTAKSTYGQGSTFTISLPLVD